ncbi:hypothetical protein [Caulobacter sp. CCUG 60055]|uniref:hypothetical protein n=1 Tax=Caulobacter sp. CCUG 60055 TaxID=2100090 RepID=UPI001FA6C14F|nr:hypothetical protein [Caulobacter sp. CCUG 60055]MBQ1543188.1 hypothetical protein [Caulobacteraceae bacterium]
MRAYKIACLAAVSSIAYAASASAATLSPRNAPFTGSGPFTLVKGGSSISCTMTVNGKINVDGSSASITSAIFSGGMLGICPTIMAASLPWTMTAPDTTHVFISGFAINTPIGDCGPGTLSVSWQNGSPSIASFTNQLLAPDCNIGAKLTFPGVILLP